MEAQTIASILGAIVSALVIGGTVIRWVTRPIRKLLDKVDCLDERVSYHLEPNGHEPDGLRRPLRTMVIDSEREIGVIKFRQGRDFARWSEHGKLHARHRLE